MRLVVLVNIRVRVASYFLLLFPLSEIGISVKDWGYLPLWNSYPMVWKTTIVYKKTDHCSFCCCPNFSIYPSFTLSPLLQPLFFFAVFDSGIKNWDIFCHMQRFLFIINYFLSLLPPYFNWAMVLTDYAVVLNIRVVWGNSDRTGHRVKHSIWNTSLDADMTWRMTYFPLKIFAVNCIS